MLLGLATYLYGYRHLPARVERRNFEGTRLTAAERRIVFALIAVMIITIFQSTAFYQVFNVSPVWIQQHVALDLAVSGSRSPGINRSIRFSAFWVCRWSSGSGVGRHRARREPDDLAKIGTGAWIAAASNLVLVAAIFVSGGAPVHPIWPFLYSAGLGISFLYYWPTLLALVSRAAPAKLNSTLMGLAFMSLFISNNLDRLDRRLLREDDAPLSFGRCTRPSPPAEACLLCSSAVASVGCFGLEGPN